MASSSTILVVFLFTVLLLQHTTIALQQNNNEVSMGTTILAVRYKDGVVVGADTRTSVSGYVSNRYAAKLTFVLDRNVDDFVTSKKTISSGDDGAWSTCVVCRSGSAADTQHLASVVRTELVSRQLLYRIGGTVTHVASLLRNLLVDNDGLSASLICAGYDHELGRGVIYTITPGGTVFEERSWAVGGSGSTYIIGHLDSCYPKEDGMMVLQSEDEALEFVAHAIGLAMERDGSSGGFIRMYVIDRFGKRFLSKMPSSESKKNGILDKKMGHSTTLSLRNFAPATTPPSTSTIR